MKMNALILAVIAAVFSVNVQAADIEAGKAKATSVCAGCHGANGKAIMPNYPNLAGQNAPYIEAAIKAYKAGERTGGQAGIMAGMAATLSDDDIKNVAAYFSSLK